MCLWIRLNPDLPPAEPRCTFESVANSYPRYLDLVIPLVADERDCERRCYSYTDFICRSYSYYPSGSQCFISGDDRRECRASTPSYALHWPLPS